VFLPDFAPGTGSSAHPTLVAQSCDAIRQIDQARPQAIIKNNEVFLIH
jgi:hypothetical protein